jgi:hypothetical protein
VSTFPPFCLLCLLCLLIDKVDKNLSLRQSRQIITTTNVTTISKIQRHSKLNFSIMSINIKIITEFCVLVVVCLLCLLECLRHRKNAGCSRRNHLGFFRGPVGKLSEAFKIYVDDFVGRPRRYRGT